MGMGDGVGRGVLDVEHGVIAPEVGGAAVGAEVDDGGEEGGESARLAVSPGRRGRWGRLDGVGESIQSSYRKSRQRLIKPTHHNPRRIFPHGSAAVMPKRVA